MHRLPRKTMSESKCNFSPENLHIAGGDYKGVRTFALRSGTSPLQEPLTEGQAKRAHFNCASRRAWDQGRNRTTKSARVSQQSPGDRPISICGRAAHNAIRGRFCEGPIRNDLAVGSWERPCHHFGRSVATAGFSFCPVSVPPSWPLVAWVCPRGPNSVRLREDVRPPVCQPSCRP